MEPNQFDNNNHQPSPFIDNAKQGQFVNNPGTNNYIQVKRSTIKYQKKGLNPKAAAKNRRRAAA